MKISIPAAILFVPCLFGALVPHGAAASGFTISPAQYWVSGWTTPLPVAADIDGDGLADVLALRDDGGIDATLTSKLGKPAGGYKICDMIGIGGIASAAARFTGGAGADFISAFDNGEIKIATGWSATSHHYEHVETAAAVPKGRRLSAPAFAATGDFDGDGKPDVLFCGADGRLILLRNTRESIGSVKFELMTEIGKLPSPPMQFAAGRAAQDARARLFWLDSSGSLMRSVLMKSATGFTLAAPRLVCKAAPGSKLAAGHFTGNTVDDVLLGQRLLVAGDPSRAIFPPNLPDLADSKNDRVWLAADIDGNGKDDIVRKRHSSERFGAEDTLIQYSSNSQDIHKGFISTARDGLLDSWKRGEINPGGLDLAALGCKVGQRDAIVEIGRFDDEDDNRVMDQMKLATAYFASLPIRNPDGTTGIHLHVIYPPKEPRSMHDEVIAHFDEQRPPSEHRGITHYFWADTHGPGVAKIMGDNGHYWGGALDFEHEFGHNLGLVHEGFWSQRYCPIYPSLMNYTYNGEILRVDHPGYSDGKLAGFALNEAHLSEYLPFPIAKTQFLAESPYWYRIKPSADGKGTLVDWNWNGIFGEEHVMADINYLPGMDIGQTWPVGFCQTSPVMLTVGDGASTQLMVIYGRYSDRTPATEQARNTGLSPEHPGSLQVRIWRGAGIDQDGGNWPDETTIQANGVTGDPSACSFGDTIAVAYPTRYGVRIVTFKIQNGQPVIAPSYLVPKTKDASPALVAAGSDIALLLWRNPFDEVGLRMISLTGGAYTAGPETTLGMLSAAPVAATIGPPIGADPMLIVAAGDKNNPERQEWHRFYSFAMTRKGPVFHDSAWQGGRRGPHWHDQRLVLLWEPYTGMDPGGRLWTLACSPHGGPPWSMLHVSMKTAYDDDDGALEGGWLTRQVEISSRSAPGACFFRGEIVDAIRQATTDGNNDNLLIAFHGRGWIGGDMGDFDDLSYIRDHGLEGSIPRVAE